MLSLRQPGDRMRPLPASVSWYTPTLCDRNRVQPDTGGEIGPVLCLHHSVNQKINGFWLVLPAAANWVLQRGVGERTHVFVESCKWLPHLSGVLLSISLCYPLCASVSVYVNQSVWLRKYSYPAPISKDCIHWQLNGSSSVSVCVCVCRGCAGSISL